jgi:hypothetical protein
MNYIYKPEDLFPYLDEGEIAFLCLLSIASGKNYDGTGKRLMDFTPAFGAIDEWDDDEDDIVKDVEMGWEYTPNGVNGVNFHQINIFGDVNIYQEEGTSGSYYDEPEAGDSYLESIDVNYISIVTPANDDLGVYQSILKDHHEFAMKDLNLLAKKAVSFEVSARNRKSLNAELDRAMKKVPPKLQHKIERILTSPSYRVAKNMGLI